MSLSFLGKKSFDPNNKKNVVKLFQAEERKKAEDKKKEEYRREYEAEQTRRHARSLLPGGGDPAGVDSSMSFMYQKPPGLAEAENRKQRKVREDAEKTHAEKDAERFAILENAPRHAYTNNMEVTHKPFAVELRRVKCKRCGEWGHSLGDRECPLRNVADPRDEERKAQDDPLARAAGVEASGAALRWAPKAATAEGMHGGGNASDANQQFVVDDDDVLVAKDGSVMTGATSVAGAVGLADLDPAVLSMLDEKQQRRLLRMYRKELEHGRARTEGADGADDERRASSDRKRKHRHKEKKERSKHKHKKKKTKSTHHSSSGRREHEERSDSSGSASPSHSDGE